MAEPVSTEELSAETVRAALRVYAQFSPNLRYVEEQNWHLNDIQGMRAAIKAALAREALANRKAGEWRPIAEAPKDGTRVLLADAKNVVAGCWGVTRRAGVVTGVDWQCDWQVGKPGDKPTHWRFLPAPPLPLTDAGG